MTHLEPTIMISPTPFSQPTFIPDLLITVTPTREPTKKIPYTPTPKDVALSTNLLLTTINSYRKEQQKQQLQDHTLLCTIAQERANELKNIGNLDNHEGFKKYSNQLKNSFRSWHEVIFFSMPAKTPEAILKEGWIPSAPHKEIILKDHVQFGCGAISDGFAVFLLTEQK